MHQFVRVALLSALFTMAWVAPVNAAPLVGALFGLAFAATIPGMLLSFALGTAFSLGLGLLLQAKEPEQQIVGVQFDIEIGDDNPIGFTVGKTGTAGTRKYIGTWGQDGKTPNAYLTDVVQVGDIPAPGEPGLWLDGKECTILWEDDPTDQGYPVEEYRVEGKDHLWVWYEDGMQTVSNDFLLSKFGAHATRPWLTSMIGRGCPYLIITALVNRELFSGSMTWFIEPPLTRWYDLRKDSTNGGSGAHRWNNPATWGATDNPAIIAYNIIRGVYYGSEWVYGGQGLPAFRLPASNWIAAANECDVLIEIPGGEQEKQFRCGFEIRGDMEPLSVLEELKKCCAGRIAEVGGIFKIQVGAPASAVYAFTDGDILVTEPKQLEPFPTLSATHNGIEATSPLPEEMYASKDAPPLYSEEYEEEDGEQRLATGIAFNAVPYPLQVQRLMWLLLAENRRFRVHAFTLPPDAYVLEPNDVVAWTSTHNGYENKKFIVVTKTGKRTSNQAVVLREIDVGDYDPTVVPTVVPTPQPTGPVLPPPQEIVGFQALPASFLDTNGLTRRPTIEFRLPDDLDDVSAVRVQVRLESSEAVVFDMPVPYGAIGDGVAGVKSVKLNAMFLPQTEYEVRAVLVPFGSRAAVFTDWIAVTTSDIGYELNDLSEHMRNLVRNQIVGRFETIKGSIQRVALALADVAAVVEGNRLTSETNLRVADGNARASASQMLTAAIGPGGAIAALVTDLEAAIGGVEASVTAESSARIAGDTALATDILDLDAASGANAAAITAEAVARASADSALAGEIDTVEAVTATNAAAISTEVTARTNADTALAGQISTTNANVASNAAAITAETTARASADTALSGQITTTNANVATNAAAISAEASTRATQDTALATSITAANATITGIQAEFNASWVAAALPSGATAAWDIKVKATVGGDTAVGGLTLATYNVGGVRHSEFIVRADRFLLKGPSGDAEPLGVFQSGGIWLNADIILNGSITADKMNADLFVGRRWESPDGEAWIDFDDKEILF